MKRLASILIAVMMATATLNGCRGTMLSTTNLGQAIKPSTRIGLVKAGQLYRQFSDGYVKMDYNYTSTGSNLQMAGVVRFDSAIAENLVEVQTLIWACCLGTPRGGC
jgi:hypothetical protein